MVHLRSIAVVVIAGVALGIGIFSKFFDVQQWSLDEVRVPREAKPSLYEHIRAHLKADGTGLNEAGETLPDEPPETGGIRWSAGALDGVMGHHVGNDTQDDAADEVAAALDQVLRRANEKSVSNLYDLLTKHSTLSYADALLAKLHDTSGARVDRLHAVGTWLATKAPDREPVKFGIVLLGFAPEDGDEQMLLTLGSHEEFTTFVAVALANTSPSPDAALWNLAKRVHGWGRIQTVERLANTTDPRIKAWLLREGFKNSVMYEYLAFTCAVAGDLESALRQPDIDDALFDSAGEILAALITGQGGPAEGVDDYERAAAAIEAYLRHAEQKASTIKHFLRIRTIKDFVSRDDGWQGRAERWTPEFRTRIKQHAAQLLSRPDWEAKVIAALKSKDRLEFWNATVAAQSLGLDAWPEFFERVASGEDYWFQLLETPDEARFMRALELAHERIALAEISTGPSNEMGLGPHFAEHRKLDSVLQALPRFHTVGWEFIKAGLKSPVIRNRNMALRALKAWPRTAWPEEAELYLRQRASEEPDEDVRVRFADVLEGRPLKR